MVWENVVPIGAETPEEAIRKADEYGRSEEGTDDSATLDGKPARWAFAGVRKIISCLNTPGERPSDGDEVTYNTYYLKSREDVAKLARGDAVTLEYDDET